VTIHYRLDGHDWKVINPDAVAKQLKLDRGQMLDVIAKQRIATLQGGKPGEHPLEWLVRLPDPDEV
jgi:hypothetical protein